ncbi:adenylyl cyclase X E-like [Drosophila kikkawai]|uniref:adenylate cyclase n=1 Tax=Drosophila kikkawai TaxID=30033 RepID=A0A6P4IRA4_DROKI|nr:adenylyl cyclase X E-like [Drosophila kikkawai]
MSSSANKCDLNYLEERTWDRVYLKQKCKELGVEGEFNAYQVRLFRSYVRVFCLLHIGVTAIHCILISTLSEHKKYVFFDVGIYSGSCLILVLILSINFWEKLTEKHTWIMFVSSALACSALVGGDLTQSLYHHYYNDWGCGSFYDTYAVYITYLFLPILCIQGAIFLGSMISIMYIVLDMTVLSSRSTDGAAAIVSMVLKIVQYLSINMLGIYCRVLNDMVVRSSFIDRHQFIKEDISLRNAQRHEKILLDSILPSQFSELLQKDIKKRITLSTKLTSTPINNFNVFRRSMAIQIHSDVSILYADVVNYTHLTTTLTVEKLVTTLHDLYARFDLAAQYYSVQRIKFLGDCYYCVAGLMHPDPDHANNAVALGFAMIAHIQEVRASQNLDINMRIGIHSGTLYAGVIGESKLQFDVWGPDVTIANVLESTGVPGAVHISEAVLRNLGARGEYSIQKGPEKAMKDPHLQKHRIVTFLIVFSSQYVPDFVTDAQMKLSFKDDASLSRSVSTVLNEELREEYRNMPVTRINFKALYSIWVKKESRYPMKKSMDFCLTFYDTDKESAYLKQKDYFFRYYMLLAWATGLSLVFVEIFDTMNTDCKYCFVIDFCIFLSLTILAFIAWYKWICWIIYNKKNKPHTYNCVSCIIFCIHEKIVGNLIVRICTYLFAIALNWVLITLIVVDCRYEQFIQQYIDERIYHYEDNEINQICFHPWVVTEMLSLMICMTFTFCHIPFLLKTSVALGQVFVYFILIFIKFDFVFHHSTTTNPWFPSEFSHGFIIIIAFVTMYFKARQTEFSKKVCFSWRVQLEKKQNDALMTNRSIIILLNNILPSHVVDIYLSSLSQNELYYESYKMVSVMFAMLTNFEINLSSLQILNEVITQFDVLLLYYREFYAVEKIKIVNCTYMAACGLDVNFAGSTSKPLKPRSAGKGRHSHSGEDHDEVVFVMASFALDLMQTLASCNKAYNGIVKGYKLSDGKITIGISSGEIMAGIVGASKPHYDIWGDPVNMAARMEMTGQSGHIHVTEESANILESYGIQANYRGQTFVKGRGLLPTYFLGIDDDFNFIRVKETRKPIYAHRSAYISMGSTYI